MSETRTIAVSIAGSVFERVPDYLRTILVAVTIGDGEPQAIVEALREECERWSQNTTPVTELPAVVAWRRAFRAVGLNPTKTRPAVEALMRRAQAGAVGSLGNAVIDVGTLITLRHGMPVGVHVLDEIDAALELAPASGDELFVTFAGETETPEPDEIVWRSGEKILTRRWVHKQGRFGSVTSASRSFAINLDALGEDDLRIAAASARELLKAAGLDLVDEVALNAERRAAHLNVPQVVIRT
jgi:DNA/RNA-binding domain of Phe-tRNA-synthetase-like protein